MDLDGTSDGEFDVVIVGASIAGCAAAMLYGRQGFKVALVDHKKSMDEYKRVCTTFIQSSALPTVRHLGLVDDIEAAGGLRNGADFWTPWGWISATQDSATAEFPSHGYCIRRDALDPLLLHRAAETPGVQFMMGEHACSLEQSAGRVVGVHLRRAGATGRLLRAKLVVAADGRHSRLARLAAVPTHARSNNRSVFFAFYRDLPLGHQHKSMFWALNPDMFFAYPYSDGLTLMCCFIGKERAEQWREDFELNFNEMMRSLPDGPDVSRAVRVSEFRGTKRLENIRRPAAYRGLALVGDAAIAADPMAGVGCGWALQSAEWLVESTAEALQTGRGLRASLRRYRQVHRSRLWHHDKFISDNSSGRRFNAIDKYLAIAAVNDPTIANQLHAFVSRHISPWRLFAPRNVLRMLKVNLRVWRSTGNRAHTSLNA